MKKEIEIETGIPIPGSGDDEAIKQTIEHGEEFKNAIAGPAIEERVQRIEDSFPPPDYRAVQAENELLKAKLEIAELKIQLATQGSTPAATSEGIKVGRPLPKPEEIPPGLPPMPAEDPLLGDKTPAIVEWFRDHWPEAFAIRYKGRKTHLKAKLSASGADDDDREEAKAPTFQPSAADGSIDTSPRLY